MRDLNNYELQLLAHLVKRGKSPSIILSPVSAVQAEDVAPEDKAWHHIRLDYGDQPWRGGGYVAIANWTSHDLDGGAVELLVLGDDDGRPYEIEIRRPDLHEIQRLPAISTWS